ncbi:MAG TPA: GAF domain-containing protein [Anaerolineaceae bacterium]|nr:GAF domain-containing protein [Anaerolineaceae bacterium]
MTHTTAANSSKKPLLSNRGIRARLTALVMILTIPLLIGVAVYISSRAGSEIQNQSLLHLEEKTLSLSTTVSTWLDSQTRSLKQTTMLPSITAMRATQQKPVLEVITQAYPNLFLVHTLDLNGLNVARSDAGAQTDYSDRAWFQAARGGTPVTYEVLISRTINKPALSMSAPIYSGDQIVGVVGYTSELTEISDEVVSTEEGGTITFIVDANGFMVAHPDPTYTTEKLADFSAYPPVAALIRGETGQLTFTDDSGVKWNAYAGRLENGWGIITQQPNAELLAPVRQFQTVAGILILLGSLAMAILVGIAIQRLLRPIGLLTDTVTAIAGGDLNQVAEVVSQDEIGVLATAFNNMTGRLRESFTTLEQRVAERTQSLELAAEVGRSVSQVRALDVMLKDAAELIRSRFNLYYVQVYLTDPIQNSLVLKSGTGSVGAELLSRNHRLPLQTSSINGRAAIEKHSIVVADTAASLTFKPNPLLPDTRSEMAIPLMVGERVVGVLDLQSSEPNTLNTEILTAFEALAGQLAIAIQNASSLAETQQARAEVEAQARRLARANWVEYLDAVHAPESFGYVFDGQEVAPLDAAETTPTTEGGAAFAAPIAVTGEVLGNLVVELAGQPPMARTEELVNSVARQVAQQIENLRLLESAERARAEAEKVSRRMTGEGWKEYLDVTGRDSLGFLYNLSEVRPVAFDNDQLAQETGVTLPLKVRDEPVGTLMVQGLDTADNDALGLINTVAERLGAHIESLRQQAQTKAALEQTENLSAAGLRLAQASDLQDMLQIIYDTLNIPVINRQLLGVFNYNAANELVDMEIAANWYSGVGTEPTEIGHRYTLEEINAQAYFTIPEPLFSNDMQNDPRVIEGPRQLVTQQNIRAMASMPLFIAGRQVGVLLLEGQEPYKFSPADTRLFIAMAPQIATVLENRRQFERAQKQAERQSTLNLISQKIQSATTVEAVLQIAARELGHALGAPRTIAQLSIKDQE